MKPQKIESVRPMTNEDSVVAHPTNKKSRLKSGSMHEIDDINDDYSDEIVKNINL